MYVLSTLLIFLLSAIAELLMLVTSELDTTSWLGSNRKAEVLESLNAKWSLLDSRCRSWGAAFRGRQVLSYQRQLP
jgi:hypothetical protein